MTSWEMTFLVGLGTQGKENDFSLSVGPEDSVSRSFE